MKYLILPVVLACLIVSTTAAGQAPGYKGKRLLGGLTLNGHYTGLNSPLGMQIASWSEHDIIGATPLGLDLQFGGYADYVIGKTFTLGVYAKGASLTFNTAGGPNTTIEDVFRFSENYDEAFAADMTFIDYGVNVKLFTNGGLAPAGTYSKIGFMRSTGGFSYANGSETAEATLSGWTVDVAAGYVFVLQDRLLIDIGWQFGYGFSYSAEFSEASVTEDIQRRYADAAFDRHRGISITSLYVGVGYLIF